MTNPTPNLTEGNYCFYLTERNKRSDGVYSPVIVVRDTEGYYQTDYDYGTDFVLAKRAVDDNNKALGLTKDAVQEIVTSSMFLGARR